MKYLLSFIALLLVVTGCATTELPTMSEVELPSEEPFQGANVILIQTDDNLDEMRDHVVEVFRMHDYDISQPTLNEQTVAVEPRSFGSGVPGSARYFFRLPEEPGQPIEMYGLWIGQQAPDRHSFQQFDSQRVMPRGERRSTSWLSWQEMQELAESYRGGTVLYDREDE
jgi:hypothetical protein